MTDHTIANPVDLPEPPTLEQLRENIRRTGVSATEDPWPRFTWSPPPTPPDPLDSHWWQFHVPYHRTLAPMPPMLIIHYPPTIQDRFDAWMERVEAEIVRQACRRGAL